MDITADSCVPSATAHFSIDCEVASPCYSDSEIDSVLDPDEILRGEALEVDSLCYSDSEIDSVLDPDEILRGEDREFDSLCYSDSEIDSVLDPDEILRGEDLEVDSLCYSDSEVDSVLDTDEILRGEDLEVDSLCFEPVLNADDMYAEETPRPSSPPTSPSPVISVEVQVVDTIIAAAVVESGGSSEDNVLIGELMHVPQGKVSKAREENVEVEIKTEVSATVRRRRSKRQQGRVSSVGVSSRTRSCHERATRSSVRAGRAMLFPGMV